MPGIRGAGHRVENLRLLVRAEGRAVHWMNFSTSESSSPTWPAQAHGDRRVFLRQRRGCLRRGGGSSGALAPKLSESAARVLCDCAPGGGLNRRPVR